MICTPVTPNGVQTVNTPPCPPQRSKGRSASREPALSRILEVLEDRRRDDQPTPPIRFDQAAICELRFEWAFGGLSMGMPPW